MLAFLIAQSTQPAASWTSWTAQDWTIFLGAVGVLITGIIAALRKSGAAQQATQNLASATKDVATTREGLELPNLDPRAGSLHTIDNIAKGGTGTGPGSL
jgi:hypothetical protein